ncbi:hypothetical protein HPP92_007001 [Vanilla planifolia]|uniref:Uncharacterized protein n=1 Tax=Vanilla planifolia TaxID=51239 RepID=A0A835RGQ6_VANPL|nr:hypothetical protein HPP92_007001 [Vanilla planifolia]
MEGLRKRRRLWLPPSTIDIRRMGFTVTEMVAAEQLVHLSESSGESSSAAATAEEVMKIPQRSISSAFSFSSSPISVDSVALPPITVAEDDDNEDWRLRRLRPRYRTIADVYAESEAIWVRTKMRDRE